jgi:hypothetical protein
MERTAVTTVAIIVALVVGLFLVNTVKTTLESATQEFSNLVDARTGELSELDQ